MLDVKDLVKGETEVRILEVPLFVKQKLGDVGRFIEFYEDPDWPLVVKFGERVWYFKPEHLEVVDINSLKIGDKVKVINRVGNNVGAYHFVNVGDVATVLSIGVCTETVRLKAEHWSTSVYFELDQIEIHTGQTQSEDFIIYKSRWDEIIENLSKPLNFMTDEEVEVVKSVLKNNVPFNVVSICDPIIEKEGQTHLDATHIGDTGNAVLYYKSEVLKKWFWWDGYTWEECGFEYEDGDDLFPITISK